MRLCRRVEWGLTWHWGVCVCVCMRMKVTMKMEMTMKMKASSLCALQEPAMLPASKNLQGDSKRSFSACSCGDAQAVLKGGDLRLGVFTNPVPSSLGCPTLSGVVCWRDAHQVRLETAAASFALVWGNLTFERLAAREPDAGK